MHEGCHLIDLNQIDGSRIFLWLPSLHNFLPHSGQKIGLIVLFALSVKLITSGNVHVSHQHSSFGFSSGFVTKLSPDLFSNIAMILSIFSKCLLHPSIKFKLKSCDISFSFHQFLQWFDYPGWVSPYHTAHASALQMSFLTP